LTLLLIPGESLVATLPRACPSCRTQLDWTSIPRNTKARCQRCGERIFSVEDETVRVSPSVARPAAIARTPQGVRGADRERTVRKKDNSYLGVYILFGVGLGFLALLLFGTCLAVYLVRSKPSESTMDPVSSGTSETRIPIAQSNGGATSVQQPPPLAPIQPAKQGGGPAAPNGAFPLRELKAASVYINATTPTMGASGSGFVVRSQGETAYVVTNHHVITPPKEDASAPPPMWIIPRRPIGPRMPIGPRPPIGPRMPRPPFGPRIPRRGIAMGLPPGQLAQLTVIFHSGTPQEQSLNASIVADDADADLAILKVTGLKDAPRPIDCSRIPELVETMQVVALGFPFGAKLDPTNKNPAITVTKGTVSSLRQDNRGELKEVQLDLDLNPGNSGGPVVDEKGALIGVAVAKITNSRIGFAVPVHKLKRLMQSHLDK
jgi:S1-C subfamily serine protease